MGCKAKKPRLTNWPKCDDYKNFPKLIYTLK